MFLFTHTHTHTANTHEHTHTEHTHAECQPMAVRETSRKVLRLGANFDIIDAAADVCVAVVCVAVVCVATVCVLQLYACWADQQRAQTSVRCFAWISNCRTLSQIAPVYIYLYMLPISKYATYSHTHTVKLTHTHTRTQSVCASIIFEFRKTSKLSFEIILNVLFRTQRK